MTINPKDYMHSLGSLVIGSRMNRLSELFMNDVKKYYAANEIDFEPRWYGLFNLIANEPEITLAAAAEKLGLTHSAISQIASKMTEKNLIQIKKSQSDERAKCLSLTTEGKKVQKRMEPVWVILRSAVDDILREAGVPLPDLLHKIEQAHGRKSLYERAANQEPLIRPARKVNIIDYVPGNPLHRHAFASLNREWVEKYFVVEQVDEDFFQNPESLTFDLGGTIIFAEVDGELVGTVALVKRDDGFEFSKMAVSPRFQGLGIGRKVAEAMIERAAKMGLQHIRLLSNRMLSPAITLYKSLGFYEIPIKKNLYARSDIAMQLDIKTAKKSKSGGLSNATDGGLKANAKRRKAG